MPRTAQRNAVVPAAVRPGAPGKRRTLCGYELMLDPAFQRNHGGPESVEIDPTTGIITVAPMTYSWLKNSNAALQALVHEKAEAVRLMQVRMVDVSSYSTKPTVAPQRPKPVVAPTGIKALCADIQTLVGEMAASPNPSNAQQVEFATRYGKYRDAMAALRQAFLEAEGEFETAQILLIQMMGVDE